MRRQKTLHFPTTATKSPSQTIQKKVRRSSKLAGSGKEKCVTESWRESQRFESTFRSMAASTKPTILLSIDLNGNGMAPGRNSRYWRV